MTDAVRFNLSDAEWRDRLSEERYHVLREAGTEPPFTGGFVHNRRDGLYRCGGCGEALFDSESKFESGSGWPSFMRPLEGHVETKADHKLLTPRVEYHCARCGGHQGHVFDDGPGPEGTRFCNNGLSLEFIPEEGAADGR